MKKIKKSIIAILSTVGIFTVGLGLCGCEALVENTIDNTCEDLTAIVGCTFGLLEGFLTCDGELCIDYTCEAAEELMTGGACDDTGYDDGYDDYYGDDYGSEDEDCTGCWLFGCDGDVLNILGCNFVCDGEECGFYTCDMDCEDDPYYDDYGCEVFTCYEEGTFYLFGCEVCSNCNEDDYESDFGSSNDGADGCATGTGCNDEENSEKTFDVNDYYCSEGGYHDYELVDSKGATCTESGWTKFYCYKCDAYGTEPIDPMGHSYGDWTVTKQATCTEGGEETATCYTCGATTMTPVEALGHEILYGSAQAPKCEEAGWNEYEYCGRWTTCDYSTKTLIEATGHSYDESTNTCISCGKESPSQGLDIRISSDGTHYVIYGMGTCTASTLKLPSVYEGKPVKAIAAGAFYNRSKITSVVIPSSITSIGDLAFGNCKNLKEFQVDENNTSFSEHLGNLYNYEKTKMIQYAIGKTNWLFSESLSTVTEIGVGAFFGATHLTELTISNTIKTIGYTAFAYCYNLTQINFNATRCNDLTQALVDKKYHDNGVFYKAGSYQSGITLLVGSSVERIPANLFGQSEECKLKRVEFYSNNCEEIGKNAFGGCVSLTSVNLSGNWEVSNDMDTRTVYESSYSTIAEYLRATYADYEWKRKY